MPKNNNQASPLDKLAEQMEQEQQAAQETSNNQPQAVQAQEQEKPETNNYVPADSEKHLVHVQLEKPYYDKRTGKRLSTPYVQKMTERDYKMLTEKNSDKDKSNAEMLGYTVKVLWNPSAQK